MIVRVLPAMLLPALIGMRVYIGISEVAFRRIVLWLLTASGVALLRRRCRCCCGASGASREVAVQEPACSLTAAGQPSAVDPHPVRPRRPRR